MDTDAPCWSFASWRFNPSLISRGSSFLAGAAMGTETAVGHECRAYDVTSVNLRVLSGGKTGPTTEVTEDRGGRATTCTQVIFQQQPATYRVQLSGVADEVCLSLRLDGVVSDQGAEGNSALCSSGGEDGSALSFLGGTTRGYELYAPCI